METTGRDRARILALNEFWRGLVTLIRRGFSGQVVLHCKDGRVIKWEKREYLRAEDKST